MVELETHDDVHVLRMKNGENRFGPAFLAALGRALDRVEEAGGPLVLTGDGKYFSNGLDLEWMGGEGRARAAENLSEVLALFARVLAFPAVTVAAINGHAFAGGAMLALAADFRLMREDRGFFCLPEVDLGLPLQDGMTALIQARLPGATAHEAIVTGRRYGGRDAEAAGIAERALPLGELESAAIARAAVGLGKPPATVAALKRGLYPRTLDRLLARPGAPPAAGSA